MSQWLEVAGLAAGSGMVGSVITKVFERRKDKAEGTLFDVQGVQAIADAAVTLIAPLKTEIEELTNRVATLETENVTTKSKLQLAIQYIRELRSWIGSHVPDKNPPRPPADLGV